MENTTQDNLNNVEEVKPSELGNKDNVENNEINESKFGIPNNSDNTVSDDVDFKNIGPSRGNSVDLSKYHKENIVIENAIVIQVPSKFTPFIKDGQGNDTIVHYMQWVLKVESVILESIGEGEDKIDFRASELFNLIQDKEGKLTGFPTGDASNLMKFMNDLQISKPEEFESLEQVIVQLKGKKATIKHYTKEKEGKTRSYLSFIY